MAVDRAFLVAEEIKSRKLAALIIGKLSDGVAALLRASLIQAKWFDDHCCLSFSQADLLHI